MKVISFCILTVLISILFSCGETDNNDPKKTTASQTIAAKWNIVNRPSPFKSIEFNKSSQAIVLKISGEYKSYFYKALDTRKFEIKDLGTIEFTDISAGNTECSFNPIGGGGQIAFSAARISKVVSASSNTQNICKTWKLDRIDTNGVEFFNSNAGLLTATFSEYGTYFVTGGLELRSDSQTVDPNHTMMSWWNWRNSDLSEMCYDHDTVVTACAGHRYVKIISNNGSNSIWEESHNLTTYRFYVSAYSLGGRVAVDNMRPNKYLRMPKNSLFSK